MTFIILGKSLVYWLGLITLISFTYQLYLGYSLSHGKSELFTRHRTNAFVLTVLIFLYTILSLIY